jgi:hypothetical protein
MKHHFIVHFKGETQREEYLKKFVICRMGHVRKRHGEEI